MADLRDVLIGKWKLLTFHMEVTADSGEKTTVPLAGPTPIGRIVFTSDNYVTVLITNPEAIKPTVAPVWAYATDEEVVRTARPMITYCGDFELLQDGDDDVLSTKVDIALDPNWMNTEQKRRVTMKEEDGKHFMTLQVMEIFKPPTGGSGVVSLSWEKLP